MLHLSRAPSCPIQRRTKRRTRKCNTQHQPKGNNCNSNRQLMQHLDFCTRVVALLSPTAVEKGLWMWHLELTEMKGKAVVVALLRFFLNTSENAENWPFRKSAFSGVLRFRVLFVLPSKRTPKQPRKCNTPEIADSGNGRYSLRFRELRFGCSLALANSRCAISLRSKITSERRFPLRLKRAKLIPIAEITCDTRVCGEFR